MNEIAQKRSVQKQNASGGESSMARQPKHEVKDHSQLGPADQVVKDVLELGTLVELQRGRHLAAGQALVLQPPVTHAFTLTMHTS